MDYKKFYENVKTHFEVLCSDEMRRDAFASEEHDLDFQVFRILSGYQALLNTDPKLNDKQIEKLLLSLFKLWQQNQQLFSDTKIDSDLVLQKIVLFNNAKQIVKGFLNDK